MPSTGRRSPTGRGGGSSLTGFPNLDEGIDEEQPEQLERLQDLQPGGWNPGAGDGNPSGLLGSSVSLPNLGSPTGLGAAERGRGYRGLKGELKQHLSLDFGCLTLGRDAFFVCVVYDQRLPAQPCVTMPDEPF